MRTTATSSADSRIGDRRRREATGTTAAVVVQERDRRSASALRIAWPAERAPARRTLVTLGGVLLCLRRDRRPARAPGAEVRAGDRRSRWPSRWPAAGRGPTSSIATAGCSPPTSPCNSLYADPHLILDLDEASRSSRAMLAGLDAAELRKSLGRQEPALRLGGARAERRARPSACTIWVCRASPSAPSSSAPIRWARSPATSSAPSTSTTRAWPASSALLDETGRAEAVQGPGRTQQAPLRAVARHRRAARARRGAEAGRGALLRRPAPPGSCSMPTPGEVAGRRLAARGRSRRARPTGSMPALADRLLGGTYELGSIFKTLTVAMALEAGTATSTRSTTCASRSVAGPYTITDLHPQGRPLSVREIFLHSSNVGAGMLALEARRRAPARVPRQPRPARADAHRGRAGRAAAAAQALGRRSRPSPSPTATAWPWRRCSSPPPWRPSSTAATR